MYSTQNRGSAGGRMIPSIESSIRVTASGLGYLRPSGLNGLGFSIGWIGAGSHGSGFPLLAGKQAGETDDFRHIKTDALAKRQRARNTSDDPCRSIQHYTPLDPAGRRDGSGNALPSTLLSI